MNIKKYYIYCFFNELMPIYPLYLLMFEQEGLSVSRISLLLAIWSVPAVFLEIPTGVFADRWSRKYMMCLGEVLKAGCYLVWIISEGFLLYALGFLLWGVGGAFRSGAEEALLYDSLKCGNREEEFERILGKGRLLSGISTIAASVLGGYLGNRYGFLPALALSALSALLAAVAAFSMKEVNYYKKRLLQKKRRKRENTLLGAMTLIIRRREVLLYSLLMLFVITTAGVLDEYDQLIADSFGLSTVWIGGWTAVRFVLIACGAYLASSIRRGIEKIFGIRDRMISITILCMTAAGALLIAGLVRTIAVMSLYGLYYLIMAAGEVLHEDYLQHRIEEEGRATVHSLIALSQNLYGILCYGSFGWLVTRSDLFHGLVWTGGYLLLWTAVLVGLYLNWKTSGKSGRSKTAD